MCAAPALLTLTADAGTYTALGGQDVAVAGIVVAPAQVGVQDPGLDGAPNRLAAASVSIAVGPTAVGWIPRSPGVGGRCGGHTLWVRRVTLGGARTVLRRGPGKTPAPPSASPPGPACEPFWQNAQEIPGPVRAWPGFKGR
jgi:hypothetical protein